MDANIESKQFKVASVSDNTNSFGLRGHILIAEDGEAWQVGITSQFAKKQGETVRLNLERDGTPDWAWFGAEIPERLPDAPRNVVNEVW